MRIRIGDLVIHVNGRICLVIEIDEYNNSASFLSSGGEISEISLGLAEVSFRILEPKPYVPIECFN